MSNDVKIKEFRVRVDAKRKALGEKPRLTYVTNALLDVDGTKVNLNTLTNEEQCVAVAGQILVASDIAARANEALDTNVTPKFGDFTADQWIADLKLRVSLIVWERQKKELAAMDNKLAALRSEDAKTSDAIADIAAQLEGEINE